MTQDIPENTPLALKATKELLNQPFVLTLSNNLKLAEKKNQKIRREQYSTAFGKSKARVIRRSFAGQFGQTF